jgi:hypothetical protein
MLLPTFSTGLCQSIIKRTITTNHADPGKSFSVFRIEELKGLKPDQHTFAVREQSGVFGDDFYGLQRLNNHKNGNDRWTPTDYFGVEDTKRTFCGKLAQKIDFREPSTFLGMEGDDDDLNIQIIANPKNAGFGNNYQKIKNRSYNVYPWTMIEGEIDIDNPFQKYFNSKTSSLNTIIPLQTDVCLYGPWVEEVYDHDEEIKDGHTDVHEIHPAEQFWWTERIAGGYRYYLNFAHDASAKFTGTNWTSWEAEHVFAIAFDINKRLKERSVFTVNAVCSQLAKAPEPDGRKHFLVFGKDTLVQVNVNENPGNELITVFFEQVGIDPYVRWQDSIVKGFVVLKTKLKNEHPGKHGNLRLQVDERKTRPVPVVSTTGSGNFQIQATQISTTNKRVKVSLKEITTIENHFEVRNLYGQPGPQQPLKLVGYVYVGKENQNLSYSASNAELFNKPQLLFPVLPDGVNNRIIRHYTGGEGSGKLRSTYNKSVVVSLAGDEKLNIMTDFVASHESGYIRTLELVNEKPTYEISVNVNELRKNIAVTREIILDNWEREAKNDPKKYKMKIVLELVLLD